MLVAARSIAVVWRCKAAAKGACQGATSLARDDHLLSQSLIEAVDALLVSIGYR